MGEAARLEAPIPRLSGRVIVLDEADRVLLFRGDVSATAWAGRETWFLPGGGAEDTESAVEAAARELAEETGLRVGVAELGVPVAVSRGDWSDGRVTYRAEDVLFYLRAPAWELDTAGFTASEREQILAHRWWTLTELQTTTATIFPRALAALLARLLAGECPVPPIELPW
jgi:8-oxo-dGTP pyrophosphatase MutT (NUDIX family)